MKKIIFISGIHGVGKTTLCQAITEKTALRHYSCSTLIKNNSNFIENGKKTKNIDHNQSILINAINNIKDDKFLLDGHFCLLDENGKVINVEKSVFSDISPIALINITCEPEVINNRLSSRDNKSLPIDFINAFQAAESTYATKTTTELNIPILHYKSGDSVQSLIAFIAKL